MILFSGYLVYIVVVLEFRACFCRFDIWNGHFILANIDAIEQEGALSSDLAALRAIRKGELEELILREEIHWKQKAKIKWVKEGDCNSKLFHKVANGSRNKNFIKILENERGLVLDSSESITEEILLYFKKLYSCPPWESWRVEGIDWAPISEESASRLDSPFCRSRDL